MIYVDGMKTDPRHGTGQRSGELPESRTFLGGCRLMCLECLNWYLRRDTRNTCCSLNT